MESSRTEENSAAGDAKRGFETWFSNLFDEEHVVDEEDQTQDSKARRLSLGGTSSSLMLGNRIANRKLLRRRRELPAKRQKQVILTNPYLDVSENNNDQSPMVGDSEDANDPATERTEDSGIRASNFTQVKNRMRWDSKRKLSVPTVNRETSTLYTAATFANHFYGLHYFPVSVEPRSVYAGMGVRVEPGSMFWPHIAKALSGIQTSQITKSKPTSLWSKPSFLPCIVVNLDVAHRERGISTDVDSDPCFSVELDSFNNFSGRFFERGKDNINLLAAIDTMFGTSPDPEGYPIAVAKRSHFRFRDADLKIDRFYGYHSSLIFLYSKAHILSEIERNAPGTLCIQKFQKARGTRPWIVRTLWDQQHGCRSVWILTSTSEYVQQSTTTATKVGQLWVRGSQSEPKTLSSTQDGSNDNNNNVHPQTVPNLSHLRMPLGTVHALHGRNLRPHHVHELATDMSTRERCNLVQASPSVWPIPAKMIEELAQALRKNTRLPLSELAADFCQDEQSHWHLLQVKALKLEDNILSENAKRRSHGTTVTIVAPLPKPRKKRIISKDTSHSSDNSTVCTRKCAGDLCGGSSCVTRASKPISKRIIFLQRASQRAWEDAQNLSSGLSKPAYSEDELSAWISADERKEQHQLVRVCEACFDGYRNLAAIRQQEAEQEFQKLRATGVKAQKACLRLYEQFEASSRKKTLGVAQAMLQAQEQHAQELQAQKRLRRKRKPKRQSRHEAEQHKYIGGNEHVRDTDTAKYQTEQDATNNPKLPKETHSGMWESESEWSGISLGPGDRVRDTSDREGTVIEIHEAEDFCLVQFDTERAPTQISASQLSHADLHNDSEFFQLSAADLIGVGPLPPSKGRERELSRQRLSERNLECRIEGEGKEEEDEDEIDPVSGLRKSFKDLFVTENDEEGIGGEDLYGGVNNPNFSPISSPLDMKTSNSAAAFASKVNHNSTTHHNNLWQSVSRFSID